MITIPAGHLPAVCSALGQFKGHKPLTFSVRLANTRLRYEKAKEVWQEEKMNPAILESYPETKEIPPAELSAFVEQHPEVFEEELELDVDPIALADVPEGVEIDDSYLMILLRCGVVV